MMARQHFVIFLLLWKITAQGSTATTTNAVLNYQTDINEAGTEHDIEDCSYLFYYETCFTHELNQDDYDLTIDVDYFWGMFESTGASPVDRKKIYKQIQTYLINPEKYNLSEITNHATSIFCKKCKEITDEVLYNDDVCYKVIRYSYPVIILVGTVGNVLSFCIMNRKSLRDSAIAVNFAILAVIDTLNLWYGLFPFYLQEVHGIYYTDLSPYTCTTGEAFQNTFLIFSALLISKMSVERFIGIYFPLKSKSFLTKKNSIILAIVVGVGTLILNSPSFFVSKIRPHKDHSHCYVPEEYVHVNQTQLQVASIFITYVPFAIIIVANIGIIMKLTCLKGNLSQQTANVQATSITVTLLVVSFVFLILTSTITIINFAEPLFFTGYHPEVKSSLISLFLAASCAAAFSNYGINFFLYISTGSTFRRELVAMFKELIRYLCCGKFPASGERNDTVTTSQGSKGISEVSTSSPV